MKKQTHKLKTSKKSVEGTKFFAAPNKVKSLCFQFQFALLKLPEPIYVLIHFRCPVSYILYS